MQPALLIRLRPTGPWRYGPSDGGHDRTDLLYRSDRLFSALTIAAKQLGFLDGWLNATVRNGAPAFTFSSLFPFGSDTLYVPPPATLWPPPPAIVTSPSPVFLSKVRWTAAQFVPVGLVESILLGQRVLADQWTPDPESGCLLRRDRPSTSPFRSVTRTSSAVDRVSGNSTTAQTMACVEFENGAGLWAIVRFRDEQSSAEWVDRLRSAFRLLSDTGFGGRRTAGWGQTEPPEMQTGQWPHVLMPKLGRTLERNGALSDSHWLLSVFSPGSSDAVDWTRGTYQTIDRGGFTESIDIAPAPKKRARLVTEGSVLFGPTALQGAAVDVAPDGFPHPVYRSGLALALTLPVWQEPAVGQEPEKPAETPSDPEALESRPCEAPPPEAEEIPSTEETSNEL